MGYIVILLLLALLTYRYDYLGIQKNKRLWYNIVMWVFILLAGLRYRIGFDTLAYELYYDMMPSLSHLTFDYMANDSKFEYGYTVIIATMKELGLSYYVLQFFQSVFINYAFFRFAKKYSTNQFLFVFLYFFLNYYEINCEIVRQGICVGISLFAFDYLVTEKYRNYIILVFIASLFHQVSLVLLVLPILKKCDILKKMQPNIYLASVLCAFILLGFYLQTYFNEYILLLEIGGRMGSKLDYYTNEYRSSDIAQGYRITTILAYVMTYVIYSFIALRKLKFNYKYYNDVAPLALICCMLNVIGISIIYRLTAFVWPFFILIISESLYKVKPSLEYHTRKKFSPILVFLFLLFLVYKTNRYFAIDVPGTNYHMYSRFYPYHSIIDKGKDPIREKLLEY